jgi:hypothetical protein
MKFLQSTVILASFIAMTAPALAQGDVIAARRDGMKGSGRLLEGVKTVLDQRGDPRTSSAGIAELIVFLKAFPRASRLGAVQATLAPYQPFGLTAPASNRPMQIC